MTTENEIRDGIQDYVEAKATLLELSSYLSDVTFIAQQRAYEECYPSDDEWEDTVDYYYDCYEGPQLERNINELERYLGIPETRF